MAQLANGAVILVALLHVYFLVLEMFLWDKPAGRKAFGLSLEQAQPPKYWLRIRACITAF